MLEKCLNSKFFLYFFHFVKLDTISAPQTGQMKLIHGNIFILQKTVYDNLNLTLLCYVLELNNSYMKGITGTKADRIIFNYNCHFTVRYF